MKDTSWEKVTNWYENLTGEEGHYYHQELIIPSLVKKIVALGARSTLDIACGQGVLSRALPPEINYLGLDLSKSLIEAAKKRNKRKNHRFVHGDARDFKFDHLFDCAAVILAIQDIDDINKVFQSAYNALNVDGRLFIVMNHPCYRIPRQSRWSIDEGNKMQVRIVQAYMNEMQIPIQTRPSKDRQSHQVYHHHRPLQTYFHALKQTGFLIEDFEEWVSNKMSTGKYRKMENRAREEFPLFVCITAVKIAAFED
ncbi:MAG: class I SAM-dependent methyltransferase [Chlamydiales bacterium]